MMNESSRVEGAALNCFGSDLNFNGNKFIPKKKYQIYGTSIDEIIYNKILIPPDYIKIDVDGLEHVVLNGAKILISQNLVREILIEINENYREQYNKLIFLMKGNNFEIKSKTQLAQNQKLFNYIFVKKL